MTPLVSTSGSKSSGNLHFGRSTGVAVQVGIVGRPVLPAVRSCAPVVCAQTELVSVFGDGEDKTEPYGAITRRLTELALSEQDSLQLIARIGEECP